MKHHGRLTLALLAASISSVAAAQTSNAPPATGTAQKPVDSRMTGQTLPYRSAFDNYVSASDEKPASWRDANALVGSIGGWRVYARESQPSAPAEQAPAAAGGKPAAHKTH